LVVAARKQSLELAGLPMPTDAVLALGQEEFASRQTQSKSNLETLAQRGIRLGGKGDAFARANAWSTATEFAGAMTLISDLMPTSGEPLLPGTTSPETKPAPKATGARPI
jgi:hypothetical protein